MNNHIIFQCYDPSIDSDIGFHYLLFIPDTKEYEDPFYNMNGHLIFNPGDIMEAYNTGHKFTLEEKKKQSAKPKDVREEFHFREDGDNSTLMFTFWVCGEIVITTQCGIKYNTQEETDKMLQNCTTTFENLITRIRPGGCAVLLNGNRLGLYELALASPTIYFYTVKFGKTKIKIPLTKSMFAGINNPDEFIITVQESTIPNIYIYSIQLTNNGLAEQYFGYIQNF